MKRIIEFLLAIVCAAALVFLGRPKLSAYFYNKGVHSLDNNSYGQAVNYFKNSLKIDSSVVETRCALAKSYLGLGQVNEVLKVYKDVIKAYPEYVPAYKAIGQIYFELERYEDALKAFKEFSPRVQDDPGIKKLIRDITFEYMADCLYRGVDAFLAGDKQKAYDLLDKALVIKSDFAYTYYALAFLYYFDNKDDEAVIKLNKAIEISPQFWPAYKLLGDVYFKKGYFLRAQAEYQTALDLNPNDAVIYNDLGIAFMEKERYLEALEYLIKAAQLAPENSDIKFNLANVYRDNGKIEEAIFTYEE